jgi:hypothetical protein
MKFIKDFERECSIAQDTKEFEKRRKNISHLAVENFAAVIPLFSFLLLAGLRSLTK